MKAEGRRLGSIGNSLGIPRQYHTLRARSLYPQGAARKFVDIQAKKDKKWCKNNIAWESKNIHSSNSTSVAPHPNRMTQHRKYIRSRTIMYELTSKAITARNRPTEEVNQQKAQASFFVAPTSLLCHVFLRPGQSRYRHLLPKSPFENTITISCFP